MASDRHEPAVRAGVRRFGDDEFAGRLSAAISRKGITLTRLAERLGAVGHAVSVPTLSYWRSGQRRPEGPASRDAVSCLEEVLGLAPGFLLGAVPPARRRGPPPPRVPFADLAGVGEASQERLSEFGIDTLPERFRASAVHVAVDVDETGNDRLVTTRLALRAVVDGVQDFPVVLAGLDGLALDDLPRLERVLGAAVSDRAHLAELGLHVWNLRLERRLRRDEVCVLEHTLSLPEAPHTYYEYSVEEPVRELLLWIRFDPRRLPVHAELYDGSSGTEVVTPIDLSGLTAVQVLLSPYGPGRAGVRWEW